ncbi:MAG: hypothetical protein N3E39_04510 [Candidatus Methanomethylicia archaeon]|nr:hypothetical protein [Candidatus Methanomethylicia archaeon]
MNTILKKEILELLNKDIEFRYAVAGYLGFSETLKRMEKLEENQNKILEEIKALREEQKKLWENQNKILEEIKALREGQEKLWRSFKSFQEDFRELGRAVGMTLDHYTATFLKMYLEGKGYLREKIDIDVDIKLIFNDKEIEVDILCKDPLIIGEVTTYIRSINEAKEEVEKLLEKKKVIEAIYKRPIEILILSVANIEGNLLKILEEIAKEHNIMIITGKSLSMHSIM